MDPVNVVLIAVASFYAGAGLITTEMIRSGAKGKVTLLTNLVTFFLWPVVMYKTEKAIKEKRQLK